jgi:hypothetical protein
VQALLFAKGRAWLLRSRAYSPHRRGKAQHTQRKKAQQSNSPVLKMNPDRTNPTYRVIAGRRLGNTGKAHGTPPSGMYSPPQNRRCQQVFPARSPQLKPTSSRALS